MSKVEYYKNNSNYKILVKINDTLSKNLLELYNNNIWNIKSTFKDYKKYCDELGKTCINAWNNDIMLYDYIWNNVDISSVIINTITLDQLESGKYNSLYTNDKANNIKTDAGYASRIKFFIKTFPFFGKFKDDTDLSYDTDLSLSLARFFKRRIFKTCNHSLITVQRRNRFVL